MIFNHAGFALLAPGLASHGASGVLVFAGSFAPVLFFFAVGFGAALDTRRGDDWAVIYKVLLLLLADQFFAWSSSRLWGLDFFAFIGISLLTAKAVMRLSRPVFGATVLIALVLLLRFVVGVAVGSSADLPAPIHWVFGVKGFEAVSYPLAPWLVYPLWGVVMARGWLRYGASIASKQWLWLVGPMLASGSLAVSAYWLGLSFHRWGTVGIGYFILSVSVLLAFVLMSLLYQRLVRPSAGMLALGGVASFMVVPVHYVMLKGGLLPRETAAGLAYLLITCTVAVLSFLLSKWMEQRLQQHKPNPQKQLGWTGMLLLAVLALGVACLLVTREGVGVIPQWLAAAGQLVVGALFAWRLPLPRVNRAPI